MLYMLQYVSLFNIQHFLSDDLMLSVSTKESIARFQIKINQPFQQISLLLDLDELKV